MPEDYWIALSINIIFAIKWSHSGKIIKSSR
jgi:hypothetical protein